MTIDIPASWSTLLGTELADPYWHALQQFVQTEEAQGKIIYPPRARRFAAFEALAPEQVRVVILGQDPYHGPQQAHGLSFSVPPGVAIPPSLRNIFKEIARDLGISPPQHGCLNQWAEQGVLLLNSVLTVEDGKAGSHRNRGWERFTDAVISALSTQHEGIVFMLWGAYAEAKRSLIDTTRHLILTSPHPSPLSAHRGFIGNGHFSSCNRYLTERGQMSINWLLD
ncbi:uracil-DNA glycosylase [Chitinimonas sp. BJYL2]|uniref:uracil-DNA glycosylase n=1 Tax=Chitinimonas sp. BJYL2 TaxID=2976696 RepID=UPI0027E4AD58|nr:uracil-DNA glycosylase [Chitinimonas sp. BJYL2]